MRHFALAATGCLELIHLVAGPATGNIQADISVSLLLGAIHQQLLPVIELGNTGDRQQECHPLLERVQTSTDLGMEGRKRSVSWFSKKRNTL